MYYFQTAKLTFILTLVLSIFVHEISSGVLNGIRIRDSETANGKEPEVNIAQGTIVGSIEKSRNGRDFYSFKGIPYGKVPARFNKAIPADGWKGKRNTKDFGPPCSQVNIYSHKYVGVEDCLTINVFVPKIENPTEALPVMFFIHGGAFVMGDSSRDLPHYFMDEDVIIVSANYRLASFGFLNAGIKGASGNQAMKDIVLALNWTKNNIENFGGNVKKITIFGISAGAAAVSHLIASPMAANLFQAGIAQSGAATVGWAQFPDPHFDEPKKLAIAVDCPTSNMEYMVECLRKIKPEKLAMASDFKDPVWFERSASPVFTISIETYKESENDPNVFLAEPAEKVVEEGRHNKVPLMTGILSHEGLTLHAAMILLLPNATKQMNEQWDKVLPQAAFYWTIAKDPCRVSSKLKQLYFKDKLVGFETLAELTNLYTDGAFGYPAWKTATRHSRFAPTYLYNFTREVKHSFIDLFGWYKYVRPDLVMKPPTHGDEMQFLANQTNFVYKAISSDSPDYDFSVNMVKLWTSFAKNGKPTHVWGTQIQGEIEAVKPEGPTKWLNINNELSMTSPTEDVVERWETLDEICRNELNYCVPLKK